MEKIEKWISNNKDIEQELIRLRRHYEHPEVGHPLSSDTGIYSEAT